MVGEIGSISSMGRFQADLKLSVLIYKFNDVHSDLTDDKLISVT